jgi:hypothetical protein
MSHSDSLVDFVVHSDTNDFSFSRIGFWVLWIVINENFPASDINLLEVLRISDDFPTGTLRHHSGNIGSSDNLSVLLDSPYAGSSTDGYMSKRSSNGGPFGSVGVSLIDTFSEVHLVISSADTPDLVSETTLKDLHSITSLGLPSTVLVNILRPGLLKEVVSLQVSGPDISSWTDSDVLWCDTSWTILPASSHWSVMGDTSSHQTFMRRSHTSDSSSISNVKLD